MPRTRFKLLMFMTFAVGLISLVAYLWRFTSRQPPSHRQLIDGETCRSVMEPSAAEVERVLAKCPLSLDQFLSLTSHDTPVLCDSDVSPTDVLYLVLSGSLMKRARIMPLHQGWGGSLPADQLVFVIDGWQASAGPRLQRRSGINYLVANLDESYQGAQERGVRALLFAAQQLREHGAWERFSWFVLVDDDTAVCLPSLLKLLKTNRNKYWPVVIGSDILYYKGKLPYLGGGGGIAVSRAAMKQFHCTVPDSDSADSKWYDDVQLGRCFIASGIVMISARTQGMCQFSFGSFCRITNHHVNAELMNTTRTCLSPEHSLLRTCLSQPEMFHCLSYYWGEH